MDEEELRKLKDSYYGQLPIEHANRSGEPYHERPGHESIPKEFSDVSPGLMLLEYAIEVMKEFPEHKWAALHLEDRLKRYRSGENLDLAFGIRRKPSVRAVRREAVNPHFGLSMKAMIVMLMGSRKVTQDQFDELADQLSKSGFGSVSGSTVSRIYYESKDDPGVNEEIQRFRNLVPGDSREDVEHQWDADSRSGNSQN